MFDAAEVGSKVEKAEYEREAPKIRTRLLAIQKELAQSPLSVVLLVGGVEGAGKAETVNLLLEWMDARGIQVHAMWDPTDEERERPPMWRFWRVLPPKGKVGVFFGSWYTAPIIGRVFGQMGPAEVDQSLARIVEFERMLHHEGTVVVKFWMHLSKKRQKKRLQELERDKLQRWRVTPMDWKFFKKYDRFRAVSEHALRRTSTAEAPWHVVEAQDARHRNMTVTRTLVEAIEERLKAERARPAARRAPDLPKPRPVNLISALDLTRKLSEKQYDDRLLKLLGAVNLGARRLHEQKKSLVCVFEGPDAAGKGGAIRRVTSAMDARSYQVISIAAPTDEERARPYLWRFWRQLPRLGRVTIFDRSWYGRVLVERVEGFCARQDWQRAYGEINAFEEDMTGFGILLVKFWLQVSAREQLRRFQDREVTPYKQYKLTEEDWRNRKKFDAYTAVACDMVEQTSSRNAPWVLVEADDKNFARVKVLETVARLLERGLD